MSAKKIPHHGKKPNHKIKPYVRASKGLRATSKISGGWYSLYHPPFRVPL